ncbi:hypothetical protein [Pandoraea pnomenusa]|uniref:hypothetical protein n=1 Tax=Pandoraea pnomenusa TaxID=93220 RepID=UPI0007BCABAB|nr:hypothetical protein [Pandoraea pnomenusa]ANC45999.1 hypothetical protein A6P55_19310 [Pandoraea pnomenusa]
METDEVPEGFPRQSTPAVVSGAQPKVCVRLSHGIYVEGQADDERRERWLVCEDLANQLVSVAQRDALKHPHQSAHQILERVRVSVARKAWVSTDELTRLIRRLQALLGWQP